jgi:archaellum biogenesis ATPase FlaH
MHERKLLSAILKDRKTYEIVKDKLQKEDWSPEGSIIFRLASSYYETDSQAANCDVDILVARAERETQSNKIAEIVVQGIRTLVELDISALNVRKEILELHRHLLANKIAAKLTTGKHEEVRPLLQAYQEIDQEDNDQSTEEIYSGVKANELVAKDFNRDNLIHIAPRVLNDHLDGGIRGGHHILVFAPTEMGKTLVVINMCFGFLRQGLRVLYVGNEDPASDIMMRMMSRLTGMNKYEIMERPTEVDNILAKRNWDHFIFANFSPGTFPQIHKAINEYDPQVVVLDQLRNIDVASESRVQALEKAATEARNTAKRFGLPIISVTQAADSASGKRILDRGDVDFSNVGIPAQCDVMIGIGADEQMEQTNMRMFSFPKNKLSGKHTPIPFQIDPLLSKVVEAS